MTILMSLVGLVVFAISLFTAGFKSAVIRLLVIASIGLAIDLTVIYASGAMIVNL
jgi:hypothetical protein